MAQVPTLSGEQVLENASRFSGRSHTFLETIEKLTLMEVTNLYPTARMMTGITTGDGFYLNDDGIGYIETGTYTRRTTLWERLKKKLPKEVQDSYESCIPLIAFKSDSVGRCSLVVRANDSRLVEICERVAKKIKGRTVEVELDF